MLHYFMNSKAQYPYCHLKISTQMRKKAHKPPELVNFRAYPKAKKSRIRNFSYVNEEE